MPTSLPPLPPASGTFWKRTKMALQISDSVKPAKAAPLTVNDALSPGSNPSFTLPPEKLLPVMNAKSRTTGGGLPKPCGTVPKSASENVKFDERLGACEPVKPSRPDEFALPRGGKSKPIAVMVEVDPGVVIADVFVMVKVNVFVCELNSHTTVAVENAPDSTPETLMVSALAVAALNSSRANNDNTNLVVLIWAIESSFVWWFGPALIAGWGRIGQGRKLPDAGGRVAQRRAELRISQIRFKIVSH